MSPLGPAQDLLARYAATVESSASHYAPEGSVSDMPRETWQHVAPAVRDVLLPERELLHEQAAWELAQLPLAKLPDLHGWATGTLVGGISSYMWPVDDYRYYLHDILDTPSTNPCQIVSCL